jgi:hypothetical protein
MRIGDAVVRKMKRDSFCQVTPRRVLQVHMHVRLAADSGISHAAEPLAWRDTIARLHHN